MRQLLGLPSVECFLISLKCGKRHLEEFAYCSESNSRAGSRKKCLQEVAVRELPPFAAMSLVSSSLSSDARSFSKVQRQYPSSYAARTPVVFCRTLQPLFSPLVSALQDVVSLLLFAPSTLSLIHI
eukprot:TRINITY_DN5648_c0_g2_i10.p1 TRINITY_DN5648_c0_g2~~TRINITY_DN5648_c0_g2_i10.p1  ORF type:complete len:126 (+),score=14.77 TRINITY_DN5648_c0_g2_i10:177-554(+)